MNKRKQGKCTCDHCGVTFEKPQSEISRNYLLNRKNLCTRRCVGLHYVNNFGERKGNNKPVGYKQPETRYSKFNYHFRNIKKRLNARGFEMTLTIEDLISQWEKQNGCCVFTGIKLQLSSYSKSTDNQIYRGSLDRIDSTKGYVKDNIQWVALPLNWMKNQMSNDDAWEVCKLISDNYIKKGLN